MLDFSNEVVQEMTKSAFNLYNKSTQLMQNLVSEFGQEIGQIKPKLEAIFELFPDVVAIEDDDIEVINGIKDVVSEEHGLMSVFGTTDYQLAHLQKSIELIDRKLLALERLAIWIEENKPSKSSDEELEPYLDRAKKALADLADEGTEFQKALKRYRNVVMVSTETLEVLLVARTKK